MNYYEYFSEVEERFSRRRGAVLLLSPLDWAVIETWREAGIPLEAVLRGIDNAFDKYDERALRSNARTRKVNGLAWCAQAVLDAAEELVEASTGEPAQRPQHEQESGFEAERVARYLESTAMQLEAAASGTEPWTAKVSATAQRLRELAASLRLEPSQRLEDLDRTLTVLEEQLLLALQASASEAELVALREQADRELAPYRSRMSGAQLKQVQQQFLHKRLLEMRAIPRLSLFYMGVGD
ncbi:hypothetical protein SAMN05421819_3168 [Bryocella elongata]|uniref:Uncharacterized protein n=1 Tax=Bryocella elongata TaxID=863522 RepID=A0A1H6AIE2_9BACT|nr:hypothetical protein [Bryocella elongata]SEG48162.1 hypothetical protein SAMN05421819_3168 [Bryocella elongata]